MNILAIDPGETTGWSFMVWDTRYRLPMKIPEYEKLEEQTLERGQFAFYDEFENLISTKEPGVIVIEEFRIYSTKAKSLIGDDLKTSQTIGVMKYIAKEYGVPVIMQSAGQAKKAFTMEKLTELGIDTSRADHIRHSQDALRHLLYFIQFNCRKPKIKKQLEDYKKQNLEDVSIFCL